jgi:hypothetical protein
MRNIDYSFYNIVAFTAKYLILNLICFGQVPAWVEVVLLIRHLPSMRFADDNVYASYL